MTSFRPTPKAKRERVPMPFDPNTKRARPRRKVKPTTKTTLKKKCDELFSKWIRSRGRCQWGIAKSCTGTERLTCAHFIRRRYTATRWDEKNCFALCMSCHVYAHNFELEFEAWVESQIGIREVIRLKHQALHGNPPDLEELHQRLRARVARIT